MSFSSFFCRSSFRTREPDYFFPKFLMIKEEADRGDGSHSLWAPGGKYDRALFPPGLETFLLFSGHPAPFRKMRILCEDDAFFLFYERSWSLSLFPFEERNSPYE